MPGEYFYIIHLKKKYENIIPVDIVDNPLKKEILSIHRIAELLAEKEDDPHAHKNVAFIKEYVDRGELGVKTNKGFYSYPKPEFLKGIH